MYMYIYIYIRMQAAIRSPADEPSQPGGRPLVAGDGVAPRRSFACQT